MKFQCYKKKHNDNIPIVFFMLNENVIFIYYLLWIVLKKNKYNVYNHFENNEYILVIYVTFRKVLLKHSTFNYFYFNSYEKKNY